MKSLLLAGIISLSILRNVSATSYYVSTTGNNSNSGLTQATAWKTLTYAASSSSPVTAGDIVYVQAGNYNESVTFSKSGTATNPITFQGYKTTPGDIPPLLVNDANPYSPFLTTVMPTFDGGNRSTGVGFNCQNQKYLVIKNFQIQNYAYGFLAGGTTQSAGNLVLYNVNIMSIGNISSSYSGVGILFGSMGTKFSNNNTLVNCQVVNSAAEGIGINGDNNKLTNCRVYCNENTSSAATDYYVIITGSYNTITSCYIERTPGLSHAGHGFTAKTNAEQVVDAQLNVPAISAQYNKFYYCIAKNMGESFCVRHRTAQYNEFYHCKAIGTHTGANGSSGGEGNCMVTRDGASDNIFNGCIAENCRAGFVFMDTVEDGDTGSNPTGHPGNNNKYFNCLIYNCYMGVFFNDYSVQSDAGDNTIANCTFYKNRYLHYAARHCTKMKYVGNIYYGCLPSTPGGSFKSSTYSADILPNGTDTYFKECNFINIEGGMPANFVANSVGSISADPLFTNVSTLNFRLKTLSPCIDASSTLSYVVNDYDSISRIQGIKYDMGAFEYYTTTSTLSASIYSTNVSCNGGSNGSAGVTASGGTAPYTYAWSNGQTTATAIGLIAGTYTVTVYDINASFKTVTVAITQPTPLIITSMNATNASSCSTSDGQIKANPSGGVSGYLYTWSTSPVQTTSTASGLSAGTYSVVVTDANSCSISGTATVTCSTTTGINQLSTQTEFVAYPNPTSGVITIKTKDIQSIVVTNISGQEILLLENINTDMVTLDLDDMDISKGLYFLKVHANGEIITRKIILVE